MKNNKVANGEAPARRPLRMCVICRKRYFKPELSRYVANSDGVLVPDVRRDKPGRGWYCCHEPLCKTKFAFFRPKKTGKAAGR